jgi:hypothetical protein
LSWKSRWASPRRPSTKPATRSEPGAVATGFSFMNFEIPNSQSEILKRCPRCEGSLPLSEFGICRARKDGLNLYCRWCIREKINAGRQALREMRAARRAAITAENSKRRPVTPSPPRLIGRPKLSSGPHRISLKFSPGQRVVKALQWGPLQFNDLAHAARVSRDELSDVLPSVMLWPSDKLQKVHSKNGTGPRVYFLLSENEVEEPKPTLPQREPRSYGISTIYQEGEHGGKLWLNDLQ